MNKDFQDLKKKFINKNYNEVIQISRNNIKKGSKLPIFFNLLSASLEALGKLIEAEEILLKAIKINPGEISFRSNISRVQRILKKYKESEDNLVYGLKIDKNNNHLLFNLGILKLNSKKFKEANNLFKKLIELNLKYPDALLFLAQSYLDLAYEKNNNEYYEKAKKSFLDSSKQFPERVYADFQLSSLIDYSVDDTHQKIMLDKYKKQNLNPRQKAQICSAIAKSYEDQNKYNDAYEHIKLSNKIRDKYVDKKIIINEINKTRKIKKIYNQIISNKFYDKNLKKKKIIFVVGMPRSGTTLVHQLLDASNLTQGLGESIILNKNLNGLIKYKKFGYEILNKTAMQIYDEYNSISSSKILIDKLPINFYWIGFIKLFFPSAKVIHVNRSLKDVCLSIYKNNFGSTEMDWSYNEKNIIEFAKNYKEIMFFWKNKYKDFIYDINYEELVLNQIDKTKKLFKFCDLEWDEEILNFYKFGKRIKTASISQVKKPVYITSINSSNKYIDKMTFLKELEKFER